VTSYPSIIRLVWPLALGMVNNAVMQFVDRLYLANWSLGALEAVLPAGLLMWIFAGFFQSVVGYSTVFVGQYHGAGNGGSCRMVYRVALALAAVFGLLSLPLVPAGNWILAQTTTSATLLADERAYYAVMMCGAVFVYGQMAAASYFTGRGHTRIVFWVNLVGNILNIALDPLFIFGFEWNIPLYACELHLHLPAFGIAGAAYATVIAMALQCVTLVFAAHRSAHAVADRSSVRAGELLVRLLRFGVPSGLYTVLNMLAFTIFVFVTGGVGSLELAVSNACFTINYLIAAPMEGFALGASTLVAQGIGRGDTDGAVRDAHRTILLGVIFVVVLSTVVLLLSRPILSAFAVKAGQSAGEFHALGVTLLTLMALWLIVDAVSVILAGAQKGAGDTKFVMGWMLFCGFVVWLPLVFAVRQSRNTMPALWCTLVIYVIVLCLGSLVRWRRGKWKTIKLILS